MNTNELANGLMLVHGNKPEELCQLLVSWLKRYPLAPLENEIILVQSNGIAQWLKLALAADVSELGDGGCGIAAGLQLSLPATFIWQVYRSVLGRQAVPESSPFDKPLLIWRLIRLLPELCPQQEYAPLQRFLAHDDELRKHFQLAERLADLFDQYQVYRADWLAAWAAGDDILIRARGEPQPLPEDQRWQAALWRALLADVNHDAATVANAGRAAVHAEFLQRAANSGAAGERPPGLPRRVMVFGISALPRQALEVLANLAQWSQVLVCVHNPCEHYWADIVADKDLLRAEHQRQQRRGSQPLTLNEEALHLHAHPLLAAWGKQGRDFIGLLDEHDSDTARAAYLPHFAAIRQRIDLFSSHGESRLLNQLQEDIRDLRPLAESRQHWPAVDPVVDHSIRFHIAHSPQREIEILHDQLLAAFNADPSLRPRDVMVMVPDIEVYAPPIQAVFDLLDHDDPRYIPFSIADQGRRQHDPLLHALEKLLNLPRSRLAVSDVLDLLEVPALRQRFAIAADSLPLLHRWIHGANIRWGLDAEHRNSLGLTDAPAENTWLFGLRRMLLGYAVGDGAQSWQEIAPFDEIGGLDAALLGPLVQLIDQLEASWQQLRPAATPPEWCAKLRALLQAFFLPDNSDDAYTLQQLELALQRWQQACTDARLTGSLPLAVVGPYWLAQLDEGSLSQRFFAGKVTFATLMPMRAIPFRQVFLIGMNDGDYPRSRAPLDFDLMGQDYRPGDRSRREDDRYLFLEALLSARESLHISWVGRSNNDNTPRPPSVLVAQLRDHLEKGWQLATPHSDSTLLAALTVEHRLQPFSPEYFQSRSSHTPLFTYAREWYPEQNEPRVAQAEALPILARSEPLTVAELAAFLRDPVKAFFRQRLHVAFESDDPTSDDQEPFDLDGLQRWQLQDELIAVQLAALQRGESRQQALQQQLTRIRQRGELAANAFAQVMATALAEPMDNLFQRYSEALGRWPEPVAHDQEISYLCPHSGLLLTDWLRAVRVSPTGERGRVVLESSDVVKDRHYRVEKLIKHWLAHVAAQLTGQPMTTKVISKVGDIEFPPLPLPEAQALLSTLMQAWQSGQCRPLPLAARSAFAWLKGKNEQAALSAACTCYEGDYTQAGELAQSTYLQRAYPSFAALTDSGEFAQLAANLLRPLHLAVYADSPAKAATKASGDSQ